MVWETKSEEVKTVGRLPQCCRKRSVFLSATSLGGSKGVDSSMKNAVAAVMTNGSGE